MLIEMASVAASVITGGGAMALISAMITRRARVEDAWRKAEREVRLAEAEEKMREEYHATRAKQGALVKSGRELTYEQQRMLREGKSLTVEPGTFSAEKPIPQPPLLLRGQSVRGWEKPFDPLDPNVDKAWCQACDGIYPTTEMGFPRDGSITYLCAECRNDWDDPEGVLNPPQPTIEEALQAEPDRGESWSVKNGVVELTPGTRKIVEDAQQMQDAVFKKHAPSFDFTRYQPPGAYAEKGDSEPWIPDRADLHDGVNGWPFVCHTCGRRLNSRRPVKSQHVVCETCTPKLATTGHYIQNQNDRRWYTRCAWCPNVAPSTYAVATDGGRDKPCIVCADCYSEAKLELGAYDTVEIVHDQVIHPSEKLPGGRSRALKIPVDHIARITRQKRLVRGAQCWACAIPLDDGHEVINGDAFCEKCAAGRRNPPRGSGGVMMDDELEERRKRKRGA